MERNEFWYSALPSSQTCPGIGHPAAPAAVPGTVPDFPPALQVLLDHHHHSPLVQVHFILVSGSVGVNNRVLLLCGKESAVSPRNCFQETWPQLKNGYEVLFINGNPCNFGANTQRYTTIQREMTVKCISNQTWLHLEMLTLESDSGPRSSLKYRSSSPLGLKTFHSSSQKLFHASISAQEFFLGAFKEELSSLRGEKSHRHEGATPCTQRCPQAAPEQQICRNFTVQPPGHRSKPCGEPGEEPDVLSTRAKDVKQGYGCSSLQEEGGTS